MFSPFDAALPSWLPSQTPLHWLIAFVLNGVLIALAQRAPVLTRSGWAHAAAPRLLVGFAASFSAKLADTCGSEIGKRWGRTTLLITTLRPVPPGTEGAVSAEGTGASLLGGAVMAALMAALGLIQGWETWLLVSLVALLATLIESGIGAGLQRRWGWLSNELVNAVQTTIAALLAIALWRG